MSGNKFVLVVANYYADLAAEMVKSAEEELKNHNDIFRGEKEAGNLPPKSEVIYVPGALEIPQALKYIAEGNGEVMAMAALGCVIRGETYHFEIVGETCARGILQVQLQTAMPVGNGVLTVDTMAQAKKRHRDKARDAVKAAMALARIKERLR